jgi:hypothetical protein
MIQQGQVFELETRGSDGGRLWASRYRAGGGAKRVQRGGFASEQDASDALERAIERLCSITVSSQSAENGPLDSRTSG